MSGDPGYSGSEPWTKNRFGAVNRVATIARFARTASGVDLTFAAREPRIRDANVKSKTPLEINIY